MSSTAGGISAPRLRCECSVPMHDLVAVAKHFGYDWRRHLGDEFAERSVTSAEEVDTKPSQAIHQCVGV